MKQALGKHRASITQALHKHCTSIAQALRTHYASITQALREHYASITRALRKHYASITQALRKHFIITQVTQLSSFGAALWCGAGATLAHGSTQSRVRFIFIAAGEQPGGAAETPWARRCTSGPPLHLRPAAQVARPWSEDAALACKRDSRALVSRRCQAQIGRLLDGGVGAPGQHLSRDAPSIRLAICKQCSVCSIQFLQERRAFLLARAVRTASCALVSFATAAGAGGPCLAAGLPTLLGQSVFFPRLWHLPSSWRLLIAASPAAQVACPAAQVACPPHRLPAARVQKNTFQVLATRQCQAQICRRGGARATL
jgi:hypothetical protein